MKAKWLIDWKSSSGIWIPDYPLQLAAYKLAFKDDAPLEGPLNVGILRLDKDTGMPEFSDLTKGIDKYMEAFIHLRKVYDLLYGDKEPKKGYKIAFKMEPSVTAINAIIDKPALIQWAANETVDYFRENLSELVVAEPVHKEYFFKKAKTAYREKSKSAMNTGTIVHDAIEAHLSGADPDKILDGHDLAQNAFLAFLEWEKQVELEPILLEHVLISTEHRYGGTVDFIGWANI